MSIIKKHTHKINANIHGEKNSRILETESVRMSSQATWKPEAGGKIRNSNPVFIWHVDILFIVDFFLCNFDLKKIWHQNIIYLGYWDFWHPLKFCTWGECLTHQPCPSHGSQESLLPEVGCWGQLLPTHRSWLLNFQEFFELVVKHVHYLKLHKFTIKLY